MQSFTRNYQDNSTEAGFQFTFYCDICNDGFKSSFIESTTYRKGKGLRALSQGAGVIGSLFGGRVGSIGYSLERGGDVISERFNGMSPDWHKEHENALQKAQNEAHAHFHRCHKCNTYSCDACYNDEIGLCSNCAPRQNIEIAAARADAMREQIWEKAKSTQVFTGNIEQTTTVCPTCGKPSGTGKFCNNCGANLSLKVCPGCGRKNDLNTRFCGDCGMKL